MKINAESKRFIKWVDERLSDESQFEEDIAEAIYLADDFYNQPLPYIKKRLLAKLEIGSAEHGRPIYPLDEIQGEMENEFLDLVGWLMVRYYSKLHDQKTKKKSKAGVR